MNRNILRSGVFAILVIALGILLTAPVEAKRYRFYCQGDHLHYGSSTGQKSRRQAMRAAISDWASFTVFEYGETFGNWRIAKSKRIRCGRDAFSKKWGCSIEATPCRRG